MRLLLRLLILVPFCAVLGIAGWLLFDNVSGQRQWMAWEAQRRALGDRFEWSELAPPALADADNFVTAPLFDGAILGKEPCERFKALEPPKIPDSDMGNWRAGQRCDLKACASAYGAQDLRKALENSAPTLRELDKASRRPGSRIPVDYDDPLPPSLVGFRGAARTLRLRALAHLERGETEAALEDVLTGLRLARHFQSEPHLLASLLTQALAGFALQPVWEGLQDHRWNERQLVTLQEELGKLDLLRSIRLGFEGERLYPILGFTGPDRHAGPPGPGGAGRPEPERMRPSPAGLRPGAIPPATGPGRRSGIPDAALKT